MEIFTLGTKSYSRRHGTYNALWLNEQGEPALWGNYDPINESYYLATPDGVLASGTWVECWDGDYEFQHQGSYSFADVRRAIQLGIF